ncbi:MAG: helix-turn-helix domain-containing protein [Clostridia bacterium]|nr:helix-turn-helix domain-containing protein [Clostridia bacterium]
MKYAVYSGKYSDERYNMNVHKDYEIIYYASGNGKLSINDKFFNVEKGDIVLVPPNVKHGSTSFGNLSYLSMLGNADGLIHLENFAIFKDNQRGDGLALMQMIQANRYGDQEYFNSLCLAFIHFVLKNVKLSTPIEKAINTIKSQITASLHDSNLDVTYLLNQSGYAEDYIRAHFRKIVGKTPIEFLTELRIKDAISLIKIYQNTMALTDVAISSGFDDYIYFSRKFKQVVGVSPSVYKKSILSENKD